MKILSSILFLLLPFLSFSQAENYRWYFGSGAGINFPGAGAPVALTDGVLYAEEGCSSISDAAGNLLFYSDGTNVWNRNHVPMPNGFGLGGGASTSSTQACLIVKKPGSSNLYYIFTVDEAGGPFGFSYSIVDMTLDAGFGDITVKNTMIHGSSSEKLAATYHCNAVDVWIASHDMSSNQYRTVLLSSAGVGAAVISSLGPAVTVDPTPADGDQTGIGSLKFSHDGKKAAIVNEAYPDMFDLLDFNNTTGVFSNRLSLFDASLGSGVYGLEFSPDNQKLYLSNGDELFQYIICPATAAGIMATKTSIGVASSGSIGQLLLGPDAKIYVSQTRTNMLGAIENPNIVGPACGYNDAFIDVDPLGNGVSCTYGLPSQLYMPSPYAAGASIGTALNCLEGDFTSPNLLISTCLGMVSPVAEYSWNFGDPSTGASNTSTLANPSHTFSSASTFTVTLILSYDCRKNDTLTTTVNTSNPSAAVTDFSYPTPVCIRDDSNPAITLDPSFTAGGTFSAIPAGLSLNATTGAIDLSLSTPGAYTITYTVLASDCQLAGSSNFSFTILPEVPLIYTKQSAIWHFGNNIGLNFLCSSPPSILNNGAASSTLLEGTTSIADVSGNLLFYGYGSTIKNRNHVPMPNGTGIVSSLSASQGFLTVPNPSNPNKYYVFHIGVETPNLYYSEVDMSLDAGLGDVVASTKNTMILANVMEHITGVEHCSNGTWVIVHDATNIYSFLVTASGIAPAVVSPTPAVSVGPGQLMASPTGMHLAYSRDNSNCHLYYFDNETGVACHRETLSQGGYGCSFSNNGRYLYVNGMFTGLYQYDTQAASVDASIINIYNPFVGFMFIYGTFQLGPDGKLYIFGFNNAMGSVIENPNSAGLACSFLPMSFPLSNLGYLSSFGCTNFIQSWFKDASYVEPGIDAGYTFVAPPCDQYSVSFTNTSTANISCPRYLWNFGDPASGASNTSTEVNPTHVFSGPGTYTVTLYLRERCKLDSMVQTVVITTCPLPVELLYFNAELVNQEVLLTWATSMELNSDYFLVQKSLDGESWSDLLSVDAAGESSVPLHYNAVDTELSANVLYYRLVLFDSDGSLSYSPVRVVYLEKYIQFQVYPNPSTGNVYVLCPEKILAMELYDASGRKIWSGIGSSIDMSPYSSGMYTLHVRTSSKRYIQKIIRS